jgi:serralysin
LGMSAQKLLNLGAVPLESIQDLGDVLLASQTFVFDLADDSAPALGIKANVGLADLFEENNLHFSLPDFGSGDTFQFNIPAVANLSGDARSTAGHPIAASHLADAGPPQPATFAVGFGEAPSKQHMNDADPHSAAVVIQTQTMFAAYDFITDDTPSLLPHTSQAREATEEFDSYPLADLLAVGAGTNAINAPKPTASTAQLADYLLNGFWQYDGTIAHHWGTSTITYNIDGLNAAEQTLAISALNAWHEVTNLAFVRTSGGANITYNHNGSMTAYETDNYTGSGIITSATIDISADWITTDGGAYDGKTGIDSYGYQTYIHETGHALGLGHQGPYNGSATYSANATYANDTWQYSVMSYFDERNFNGGSYRYVITPQMADIYAAQAVYGPASTRTGDTVYGFNSTAGSLFNFATYTQAPAYTIYDSGGIDTLDASGYSGAQTIDLRPGNFSSIGGLVHNIGISTTTIIEKAVGGSGNDTLIANDSGNTLSGGGGNDTLTGGAGADRLIGGAGVDTITGAAGADVFVFLLGDSSAAAGQHDMITDFTRGQDKIDLSLLDAIPATSGILDMFTFLATAVFNGIAGVLDYFYDTIRAVTVVQGDTNGDRVADFAIDLAGNFSLAANDFLGVNQLPVVIETNGVTKLTQVGSLFYLYNAGGTGPSLKYSGTDFTAGQFALWQPIGAEVTPTGYEVAWKVSGSDQYAVWATDSNGNYLYNIVCTVSGTVFGLQALEASFQQDLNGDGHIGVVATSTTIESRGSTTLIEGQNNFYLTDGSAGPSLKYGGVEFTDGQFDQYALWKPIGAETISGGYEVAWKVTGSDQYTVWATNSAGNYISNILGVVSGNSSSFKSIETSFHQDLNGDGLIGLPTGTIESNGSTALSEVGSLFYLGSSGPSLKYGGTDVMAGQFDQYALWEPIGVEAISGGYEVAWKVTGSDQYTVWATNSAGNYVSNILGVVSANSSSLKSIETSFHQDLNGDGVIGLPTATIEASGSITLSEVSGLFYLGSTGPSLKYGGTDFTDGQFDQYALWKPIGAEAISGGYEVAWKVTGSDQYTVWATDSTGNYVSNILGVVSANNSSLKSIETSFHQDLNGDGVVGVLAPALGNAALSSAMLSDGASANTFVFAPNFGNTNVSDIHPGEDIVTFDHTLSTITAVVGSNMPGLGHAYEVATVDAYDMVAVQAPTPPTLQQHPADFYFV